MRLKALEQWWKRLWIRLLVRAMRRGGDGPPDWNTRPAKVLFLRHDRVGDMIVSTGVMRAIARSHPGLSLDVLASPLNAPILDGADYVHEVIVFDKRRIASYAPTFARLRRARYDAVIDCMVTAPSVTTLLLVLASGARYRVGISGRGNDAAFNVAVPGPLQPDVHMIERLAALGGAFGVADSNEARQLALAVSPAEEDTANKAWSVSRGAPRVLINISAGTPERVWPEERYAEVIRHISAAAPHAAILVIASPGDADLGARIAAAAGARFVKTPSLRNAIALVATSDFVFTPDTSIVHAASAFRRPAVAIYARGKKADWALYGTIGRSVEHTEPALSGLPLEPVLRAVDEVFAEAGITRA